MVAADLGVTIFGAKIGLGVNIDPTNPNWLAGSIGKEIAKIFTGMHVHWSASECIPLHA